MDPSVHLHPVTPTISHLPSISFDGFAGAGVDAGTGAGAGAGAVAGAGAGVHYGIDYNYSALQPFQNPVSPDMVRKCV